MEEISYYSSFALTALFCGIAMLIYRRKAKSGSMPEKKAKNIYSLISVLIGASGGTLIFHGLVWLFDLLGIETNFGHGEILIAAILYNFALGLVLLGIGRIIIGWKKPS